MDASMGGMDVSSLKLIGAAVTPAVMVSGCGILATGLDNQVARMTTRMREMMREWRSLPDGHSRRAMLREEVAILDRRHVLLARSLMLAYAALLSFVVTSLLYLVQGHLPIPPGAPVVAFSLGVALLGGLAVFALASLRLGRRAILLEEHELFNEQDPPPSPPGRGPG